MTRPNILIFCTDEQCADHMSCMGHPHIKTPNIDRIAAEGTMFRSCYSTNPVCMPARATMVTGLTSRAHGVVNNGFDSVEEELVFTAGDEIDFALSLKPSGDSSR